MSDNHEQHNSVFASCGLDNASPVAYTNSVLKVTEEAQHDNHLEVPITGVDDGLKKSRLSVARHMYNNLTASEMAILPRKIER
jgi:hypothetical protein